MSVSRNEPEVPQPSAEVEELERLCESLARVLGPTLRNRYAISEEEGNALLRDACFAFLQLIPPPSGAEVFLITSVFARAEALYRRRCGAEPVPNAADETAATRNVLSVLRGLELLPPDAQKALRLRFHDRKSYAEIAAELDITAKFAKTLVTKSWAKLRAWQERQES